MMKSYNYYLDKLVKLSDLFIKMISIKFIHKTT